jgi:hypothetical protein
MRQVFCLDAAGILFGCGRHFVLTRQAICLDTARRVRYGLQYENDLANHNDRLF